MESEMEVVRTISSKKRQREQTANIVHIMNHLTVSAREEELKAKSETLISTKDSFAISVYNLCCFPITPYKIPIYIARNATVGDLKKKISEETHYSIEKYVMSFPPKQIEENPEIPLEMIIGTSSKPFHTVYIKRRNPSQDSDFPVDQKRIKPISRFEEPKTNDEANAKFSHASPQQLSSRTFFKAKRTISTNASSEALNYLFYTNQTPRECDFNNSEKRIITIDEIFALLYGNYTLLETNDVFFYWLFPVYESGGLEKNEPKFFKSDVIVAHRLLMSYKIMLNFFGLRLVNEVTGEIGRSEIWKERYEYLNNNPYNYRRINRILTSLWYLGFQRYKYPLLYFLQQEIQSGYLLNAEPYLRDCWNTTRIENTSEGKTTELSEGQEESIFFTSTNI